MRTPTYAMLGASDHTSTMKNGIGKMGCLCQSASTPQLAGPSVGVGPGVAPGGTGETCTLEVQIPWIGANRNSTPTTMPTAAAQKVARSPIVRTRTLATYLEAWA